MLYAARLFGRPMCPRYVEPVCQLFHIIVKGFPVRDPLIISSHVLIEPYSYNILLNKVK